MRTWAQLVKCCLKSCATIRDKGCLLIMRVQNFFVPIRLKTCGCILLVLAVFVLILMLYVTDILEIPKSSSVTPPAGVWDNFCKLKPLSPKEAFEEDLLLQSIAWPDTPPLKSLSLRKSSDPAHSNFTIFGRMGGGQWQMGDKMEVIIKMYDFQGRPKNCGGDVIVARLHNPTLGAGVAGKVVDHLNGSYSVVFSLLWEGTAQVEVTLVHPSEAVTVLGRLTREQPDRVFFESQFRSGRVSETTTCNVCLRPSRQPVCNYTELHTGQQWFCYKPKKLSCDARISHSKGGFTQNITVMEKKLFQSGVNLKVSIQASGHANITVLQQKKGQTSRQPEVSLESGPSGYYYQGVWRALDGTTVWQFNTSSAITQCLRGKVIKMYGDSTIRQLFEYFNGTLSGLKEFNLHSPKQTGPFIALDYPNNIFLTYRCHGPPIRFMNVPISELHYIANELDNVIGGSNTVVVLGIWSHFSTFPIEVYIRRLQSIRRAVVRLLSRAPETLVVIRTANPKALNLFETLTNSDWYSLQRDKVLRAMFKGLNVHLVDAWEMVVAYNLPHSLHPQPPIIKNMINVLLSYICPQKGG